MGISTFAHLLTDDEMRALKDSACSDEVLRQLLKQLCERPFVGDEEEEDEGKRREDVDVRTVLMELLDSDAALGNHVHLVQKTKFWEARLEGNTVSACCWLFWLYVHVFKRLRPPSLSGKLL
jgi:hypothetical protein